MPTSLAAQPIATQPDRDTVVATLVASFAGDTAVRMFYPSDADYRRHFPGFLVAFCGRAFDDGIVDQDPAGRGVALWFAPGVEPDGDAIMAHLAATIPAAQLEPLAAGMEIQAAMHPNEPHWYLPWMGVRPDVQGTGLGTALLRIGLARVDAEGMPVYLEATSRRNAALYARHGFVATGVVEAPGYPEIITMWRRPQVSEGGRANGPGAGRRRML